MRRRHLEALRPLCPVCRAGGNGEVPLSLANVFKEDDGHVVEGLLRCPTPACQREYPILDGLPLLLADLRGYVAGAIDQINAREDFDAVTESLLGDCCGPGSSFDATRQHLSTYAWDHYADLDPEEGSSDAGSVLRVLTRGLDLAGEIPPGPILDLGCAVGRSSFGLAGGDRLVLGIDLGYAMLRMASGVLRQARARYPRRRVGIVYDRRDFPVSFPHAETVDFWLCDATDLPFPEGTFAAVVGLNILDCVADPHGLLASLPRLLKAGGKAILSTPYDWSPRATPLGAWIGGHSQRGGHGGASEPVLRALLTPGAHPASIERLRIVAEEASLPWRVRMHERSSVEYRVDLVVVEATAASCTTPADLP
ncbi:MAG TPA: methyltransferase domain-containing protein [Thermoanaerobaculia bacterium]|nr:methyltransferase domain-containing protein [Thermoanaerobaculia bacterium]